MKKKKEKRFNEAVNIKPPLIHISHARFILVNPINNEWTPEIGWINYIEPSKLYMVIYYHEYKDGKVTNIKAGSVGDQLLSKYVTQEELNEWLQKHPYAHLEDKLR